jgi:hypothetical protein
MNSETSTTEAKLTILGLALDLARIEYETAPKKPKPITVESVLDIARKLEEFSLKEVSAINIKKTRSRRTNSVL